MRALHWIALSLLLLFLTNPHYARAQDNLHVRMLGEVHHYVNQSYDVAMSGDFAYVASGLASGLRVLDLSSPTAPLEMGCAINADPCPGVEIWMADRVRTASGLACMLYYDGTWSGAHYRLYAYDVANPAAPSQLGYASLPDLCTELVIEGDRVYVTVAGYESFRGVKVIDISDPDEPAEIGSIATPGFPQTACTIGDTLFVADKSALLVFDVSRPDSPLELGSYSPPGGTSSFDQVDVQGAYAYVLESLFGLRILDVSDLAAIHEVATVPHYETSVIFSPIRVSGDFAYYLQNGDASGKALVILDVTDPTSPLVISSHGLPGDWWFYGFDYDGGRVCIARGTCGLSILDVSAPGAITELGCYQPYGLNLGVAAAGDYAFVSTQNDGENLIIYDTSDPTAPAEVNALSFPGRPKWISVRGERLYVPGVEVNCVPEVSVLDVSNPAEPQVVGHLRLPSDGLGVPLSVEQHEDYAFVAMAYGGVQAYDVSAINEPLPLGRWTLWDPITNPGFGVRNLKIAWPYLFLPDEEYGLYVLDASDLMNIVQVAQYPIAGSAWWVDLSPDKNHLYLADYDQGVYIFDVSDPLMPSLVKILSAGLSAVDQVLVSGDSLYVLSAQGIGLRVYDVSDPGSPAQTAFHRTPGLRATDITVANGLIHLADYTHYEIFELLSGSAVMDRASDLPSHLHCRILSLYPNPCHAAPRVLFELPKPGDVALELYNVTGQRVRSFVNGPRGAGRYAQILQTKDLASGTYFLCLKASGTSDTRVLTLVQ